MAVNSSERVAFGSVNQVSSGSRGSWWTCSTYVGNVAKSFFVRSDGYMHVGNGYLGAIDCKEQHNVAFGIYKTKGVYMNKYKIKASTIMRCVALILVLINQVLAIFGKGLPFADELVYQIASVVLTIVVGIWSAWKNNDFTKAARVAGKVFDSIKDGSISQEEAKELIESADALMTAEEDDEETDEELVSE